MLAEKEGVAVTAPPAYRALRELFSPPKSSSSLSLETYWHGQIRILAAGTVVPIAVTKNLGCRKKIKQEAYSYPDLHTCLSSVYFWLVCHLTVV